MLLKDHPKNESAQHYELKQIAKYIAKQKGCTIIAEEVDGFMDCDIKMNANKHGKVDVAAIKIVDTSTKELPDIVSYAFESKASLSDFKSGFNAGADYNYIIAPKGVIPQELIPKGVGFYEIDLDNYSLSFLKQYSGIELVKRASNRGKGRHYRTRFKRMQYVAARTTNMDLYNNCKIKMEKVRGW